MAAIHPDIETLLSVLDEAGLSALAKIARDRLDDPDDPRIAVFGSVERRDGDTIPFELQLEIIDTLVEEIVTRELEMRRRLRGLAGKFGLDGIEELASVGRDEFAVIDDFMSLSREDLLTAFRHDWRKIIQDLNGPSETRRG